MPMNGEVVHFERAAIVAVCADLPAATKTCLTGSSCNTCFLPVGDVAAPNATAELRTWANMEHHKTEFLNRIAAKDGETPTDVAKEAKRIGVNLHIKHAFKPKAGFLNIIGPDDTLDNHSMVSVPACVPSWHGEWDKHETRVCHDVPHCESGRICRQHRNRGMPESGQVL